MLAFISVISPDLILYDLIEELSLDGGDVDDALIALANFSLLHHSENDGVSMISVHRLVQATMRKRLGKQLGPVLSQAIGRHAAKYPDNGYTEPNSWPLCEQLLHHVLALRDHAFAAELETPDLARLLNAAGNFLSGRGAYGDAERLLHEAAEMGEKLLGPDHADVGQWLNDLGNVYLNTGHYREAEDCYRRAISIGIVRHGRETNKVATRLNNLAIVLTRTERHDEAEVFLREAVETVKKTKGSDSWVLGARLYNLAVLLETKGNLTEAEQIFRESIAIGEANLGRSHPRVSDWIASLAGLLSNSGRHEEAEQLYREAIANLTATLSENHASVGFARTSLARLLLDTGRLEDATKEAAAALQIREGAFGKDHKWNKPAADLLAKCRRALAGEPEIAEEATEPAQKRA